MNATAAVAKKPAAQDAWRSFNPGAWQTSIDVRGFIVANVTPYDGDEKFLAGPTERTKGVWAKLQPYFREEQKKGVLDVDTKTPSTVLAHKAGYIDKANEVIVGLQTDAPFKRAMFPYGGLKMVQAGAKSCAAAGPASLRVSRTPTAAAGSSATTAVLRFTASIA
jgi:formate C-acetyltransferase